MIEIALISLQIIFVLYLAGIGFTAFFIPRQLKDHALWISPWIGTILITLFSVYLSMLGVPMKVAGPLFLAASVVVFFLALLRKKITFNLTLPKMFIGILTAVIFACNIYLLVSRVGFPTVISMGNLDPLAYVNPGDYLVHHGVFGNNFSDTYRPSLIGSADLIEYSFRWGPALLLSFLSVLLQVRSYALFSILSIIYFAITYPLVYVLADILAPQKKSWHLIAWFTFLTHGINATLLYMLYNAFYGQVIFAGVISLFFIYIISYLQSNITKSKKINGYDLVIALTLSSLTTLYPDGIILVYVPLIAFGLVLYYLAKYKQEALKVAKVVILSAVINPFTFFTASRWILRMVRVTTMDEKIGWEPIRYALPFEALGFHNINYSAALPGIIGLILTIGVLGIFAAGFSRIRQKFLILCYVIFFISLLFLFKYIRPNFFVYYRALTYTLFLFSSLFAIGMVYLLKGIKNKVLAFVIIAGLSLLSFRSAHRTFYQMYYHMRIVDAPLVSLAGLNANKSITNTIVTSDVYAQNYDVWTRLWREHFLPDKKIITATNYSNHKDELEESLVLVERNLAFSYSPALLLDNVIWENDHYKLGTLCHSDECLLSVDSDLSEIDFQTSIADDSLLISGWHMKESGQRWTSSSSAALKLVTKEPSSDLIIEARTFKEPQLMTVFVNNRFSAERKLSTEEEKYFIPLDSRLPPGIHIIRFEFSNEYIPSELTESADTRSLYGDFFRIGLQ